MDVNVDPCADFYEFACGNYIKEQVLENSEMAAVVYWDQMEYFEAKLWSVFESDQNKDLKVIQQMKMLYQSCVDLGKTNFYNLISC